MVERREIVKSKFRSALSSDSMEKDLSSFQIKLG